MAEMTPKTPEEFRRYLDDLDQQLGEIYRERRSVMEEFAEKFPPVLPPPRYRTDHQARVARCPRCGGSLAEGPVEKATRERYEKMVEDIGSEEDGAKK